MNEKIDDEAVCVARKYGNTLELTTSLGNHQQPIKKLNKDEYVVKRTGEIKQYVHHEKDDYANLHNVRATMRRLRRLISVNFDNQELKRSALWITLTYAENMQSASRLQRDFKRFMARLSDYLGISQSDFIWISCVEPQARGAYHIHLLIKHKNPNFKLFLPNKLVNRLWGQGFVNVQRISRTKNNALSRYLSAYLTDLALTDDGELDEKVATGSNLFGKGKKRSKSVIKGARLGLYQRDMKIFRHSIGLPSEEKMIGKKSYVLWAFDFKNQSTEQTFFKHFKIDRDKDSPPFEFDVEYLAINQ